MDKTKTAVPESGEVETPVSTSPVEEQKTQPEVISEVSETAEKPEKTPEEALTTEGKTLEAQDEKSEQGKAFAEMRHRIKELERQVEEKQARQSSFDNIRNIAPQPPLIQVDPNQFVDQAGNFNRLAYDAAQQQANLQNQQASRQIAAETVEYKLDEYRARQKHPALNTNRKFERAVAVEYQARLLETINNPTARQPRIEEIADEYAPYFSVDQKTVIKETTQKVKEQIAVKEQASLSASGRSQPAPQSDAELDDLRKRSRRGDAWAIAERMRRLR